MFHNRLRLGITFGNGTVILALANNKETKQWAVSIYDTGEDESYEPKEKITKGFDGRFRDRVMLIFKTKEQAIATYAALTNRPFVEVQQMYIDSQNEKIANEPKEWVQAE